MISYEQMSDAEIDELYAMLSSAPVDVWGGDSRDLTPEEQTRYEAVDGKVRTGKCLYRVNNYRS